MSKLYIILIIIFIYCKCYSTYNSLDKFIDFSKRYNMKYRYYFMHEGPFKVNQRDNSLDMFKDYILKYDVFSDRHYENYFLINDVNYQNHFLNDDINCHKDNFEFCTKMYKLLKHDFMKKYKSLKQNNLKYDEYFMKKYVSLKRDVLMIFDDYVKSYDLYNFTIEDNTIEENKSMYLNLGNLDDYDNSIENIEQHESTEQINLMKSDFNDLIKSWNRNNNFSKYYYNYHLYYKLAFGLEYKRYMKIMRLSIKCLLEFDLNYKKYEDFITLRINNYEDIVGLRANYF